MKKLSLCVLLAASGSLFAMESNYVKIITGVGPDAKHEIIYDPMMADMMRSMNNSEEDNLITQMKNEGTTISRDQARALINNIKNSLSEESVKKILEQDQKNEETKTQERAQDSKKAFAGMKKGFFNKNK